MLCLLFDLLRKNTRAGELRFESPEMTERGDRRWVVDISEWNPSQELFHSVVSMLPIHDRSAITRFIKFEDKKRALVSRLLQYSLVREVLGISFDKIIISRTIEGKPYLENVGDNLSFPSFNFNVSHHGDYVGIASEPECLVGLDIISSAIPVQETVLEYIENFSSYFTNLEWKSIINAGNPDETLVEFYRYWCLKEAYVKALGAGLGYGLHRLEFHHTNWTDISVLIDGLRSRDWKFCLIELDKGHWAAVAKRHPERARGNQAHLQLDGEDCLDELQHTEMGFVERSMEQLIPVLNEGSFTSPQCNEQGLY